MNSLQQKSFFLKGEVDVSAKIVFSRSLGSFDAIRVFVGGFSRAAIANIILGGFFWSGQRDCFITDQFS